MTTLLLGLLECALGASMIALAGALCCRVWPSCRLRHFVCLLVLLRLLVPAPLEFPAFTVSIANPKPAAEERAELGARQQPAPASTLAAIRIDETGREVRAPAQHRATRPPVQRSHDTASTAEELRLLAAASQPSPEPTHTNAERGWWSVLAWSWALGAAAVFLTSLTRIVRFGRALRRTCSNDGELTALAVRLAPRLGLRHPPRVSSVRLRVPPMVWAPLGRPRVLVPKTLWQSLSDEERLGLLAHEFAHIARRDHWVRFVELAALCLYWWLPLVWWVRRELRRAEEECCDRLVVGELPHSTRAYARAIVQTLDFLAPRAQSVSLLSSGLRPVEGLRRRLAVILQPNPSRKKLAPRGLVRAATAGSALLLLSVAPGLGQDSGPVAGDPGGPSLGQDAGPRIGSAGAPGAGPGRAAGPGQSQAGAGPIDSPWQPGPGGPIPGSSAGGPAKIQDDASPIKVLNPGDRVEIRGADGKTMRRYEVLEDGTLRSEADPDEVVMYRLRHAIADEVVPILLNWAASKEIGNYNIVADSRTNSLLLSVGAAERPRVLRLVEALDQEVGAPATGGAPDRDDTAVVLSRLQDQVAEIQQELAALRKRMEGGGGGGGGR